MESKLFSILQRNKASKIFSFILFLLFFIKSFVIADENALPEKSRVVELTDQTFEHLTQASTGATTGAWFVKFYAPWCGHCRRLEPLWEELAKELEEHGVICAKVDGSENRNLMNRFQVRGYPHMKLFHKGEMWTYTGTRSKEDLLDFARGGYADFLGDPVPKPPTLMKHIKDFLHRLTTEVRSTMVDGHSQLMADLKRGLEGNEDGRHALYIFGGLGLGLLMFISMAVFATVSQANEARRPKQKKIRASQNPLETVVETEKSDPNKTKAD